MAAPPPTLSRVILDLGVPAAAAALRALAASLHSATPAANAVTAAGQAASYGARQAVLRAILEQVGWNLTRAAEVLRMGGAGSVVKMLRDLDLQDEYRAARQAGSGNKRGRPRRVAPDVAP
jgi:hypothetical protein